MFYASVAELPALVSKSIAKRNMPPVSHQPHMSANDKGDNKLMPGAVYKSPGICLMAEENLSWETV